MPSEKGIEVGAETIARLRGDIAQLRALIEKLADAQDCVSMLVLCGEEGGMLADEKPANYLRRLIDALMKARAERWQPIETFGPHERLLVYAPPENLYEKPDGMEGEMRVSTPQNYTWATYGQTLPDPPGKK